MSEFFGLFESHEDDPDMLAITEKGLGEIADWCRFNLELSRFSPDFFVNEDGEIASELRIAVLVWFILVEAYNHRGFSIPGVDKGFLFPKDWENDD